MSTPASPKRFGLLQAFFMSFSSSDLYRDIARNWRGVGLLYLFCLLLLASIPATVKAHLGYSAWVERDAREAMDKIPLITITNGEVSTDVETPYYIRNSQGLSGPTEETEYAAVIDLTGQYKSLEDVDARVLLTKRRISYRNRNEIRSYDLSGVQKFDIDGVRITGWLRAAKSFVAPITFMAVLLFSFVYRAVQAAVFAAIGMLFVKWKRARLEYPAMMRLAAVAVTPTLVLNEIVFTTGFQVPGWTLICFAIAMGYLLFAVGANAAQEAGPTG